MDEKNKTVESPVDPYTAAVKELNTKKPLLPWELENPVPEQEDKKEHKL